MSKAHRILTATMLALCLPMMAVAQDAKAPAPDNQPPAAPPPPDAAPSGIGVPGPAMPGNPNLQVASVKNDGGFRASKVIGAPVYNSANQQVGTVDDVILNQQNQAILGVISVGGFLGVGGKLVAVPYTSLQVAIGKVTLPDASKDSLNKMPNFVYAQ